MQRAEHGWRRMLAAGLVATIVVWACAWWAPAQDAEQAAPADAAADQPADQPTDQAAPADEGHEPSWEPALEEIRVIDVLPQAKPYAVHNFCLNRYGYLYVGVGGERVEFKSGESPYDVDFEIVSEPTEIRMYNATGTFMRSIPVQVTPEAIAILPNGTIFIGGAGRLARLSPSGQVLATAESPGLSEKPEADDADDAEEAEEKATSEAKAEAVVETVQAEAVEQPEEEAKTEKPDDPDKAKIEAYRKKIAEYQQQYLSRMKRAITGIAVTERDLFVACPTQNGFGYAVWRMDHDFQNPVKIVEGMRGCCGQMDIQAHNGELYVAENGRHRVTRYDRDGNELASFGKHDRKRADGFGGCCEPKNLRITADGSIYAAESGPPVAVKRFTPDGEFVEVVAMPVFKTGCVRVSIEVNPADGHVFVLNGGENKIHVFGDKREVPTHKQVAVISITDDSGGRRQINTFCRNRDGNLLVAAAGRTSGSSAGGEIRVVSPTGEPVAAWPLDFVPTAVNVAPDGEIYVGGGARLVKLDAGGKRIAEGENPTIATIEINPEEFLHGPQSAQARLKELEARNEQTQQAIKQWMDTQKKQMEETIEKAKDDGKEDEAKELAAWLEQTLKSIEAAKQRYQEQLEGARAAAKKEAELSEKMTPDEREAAIKAAIEKAKAAAQSRAAITGIAVTDKDVFVSCRPLQGYGYQVYRTDRDFGNPKKIVDGLRGCCGQMDIQAHSGDLYVAENARFRVARFDRDGKELASWGSRAGGVEGWGSCCNPMNIRFGPKGNVYTSEASVGSIKQYTPDGQFLGMAASAKIIPGCKHVAIDVSDDGGRIFMLDITRSQIVVFAPRKTEVAQTPDTTTGGQ